MNLVSTLLADDHALVRAGLKGALTQIPELVIVGEAGNGHELAQALHNLRPDLLVLDLNMPDFDPLTAIYSIRAENPNMKIMVVSAHDDQTLVVGLLSAGVNGYHIKDQPLSDLQLAVRRILDGGKWISDPLIEKLIEHQSASHEPSQPNLTRRQRELLFFLTQGYNNQRIALAMDLSVKTIENHLTSLYRLIGAESRLEANNYALRHPELMIPPGQEKSHPKPVGSSAAASLTVLVVDDNARYRGQLARLLEKTHPASTIYEAEDSAEAVRIAGQVKPRLILMDIVLRDEDGIQCARKIKSISGDSRIVLISAYPDREFHRLGLQAGAVALLDKKDLDARVIKQVLDDVLAN